MSRVENLMSLANQLFHCNIYHVHWMVMQLVSLQYDTTP